MKKSKKFVIALGGSVFFPEEPDPLFIRRFSLFLKKEISTGKKFIIVIGGGALSRKYQQLISKVTKISDYDKDWIGIKVTQLNAFLLKTIFKKIAHPEIFDQRFKIKKFGNFPLIIGAGWKPGWSTDFVALQITIDFGLKETIILGKPDYVYDKDFEKEKKAKPIKKLTWSKYLNLIPKKWKPGLRVPVDPLAGKLAKEKKIRVIVAQGRDLLNLKRILERKPFKGTIID